MQGRATPALVATALGLSVLACGQTIHSQVSAYHQLTLRQHDATYAFMPLGGQRGDRDFQRYAARVRAHLTAHGFVPEVFDRAEFVVAMAYANDDGSDALASYPIIGQTGSSASRLAGTLQAYRDTMAYAATTEHSSAPDSSAASGVRTLVATKKVPPIEAIANASVENVCSRPGDCPGDAHVSGP